MKNKILLLKDLFDTENIPNYKLEIAMESLIDEDYPWALQHIDELCYDAFNTIPLSYKERHLLRFVKLTSPCVKKCNTIEDKKNTECHIIKDIINNEITLSSPKKFNDPMDPLIKIWLADRKNKNKDKIERKTYQFIDNTIDKIRICCMASQKTKEILQSKQYIYNTLMWSHYADSHKGICIQYKVSPSQFKDEKNRIIRLLDVNYNKKFPLNGDIFFTDSLVVKSNYWKYENETRIIMYSNKKEDEYCQLSSGFDIEAIYMGCEINNCQRKCIKEILKAKDTSIKLYQMQFSKENISILESHEIPLN